MSDVSSIKNCNFCLRLQETREQAKFSFHLTGNGHGCCHRIQKRIINSQRKPLSWLTLTIVKHRLHVCVEAIANCALDMMDAGHRALLDPATGKPVKISVRIGHFLNNKPPRCRSSGDFDWSTWSHLLQTQIQIDSEIMALTKKIFIYSLRSLQIS